MESRDDRPVALVTGARKGIGRHLCEHLLQQGYFVVGCSRRAAEWSAENFTHLESDVSKEKQVKSLFRFIHQEYGRLDTLINNAAVASMNHVLLTPVQTLHNMLETNVSGTLLVSREAIKLMRKRRFGRIVNVSSVAVPLRLPGEAAYITSKSAVVSLSQVMAREVSHFGITVNIVGPGPTATDMLRGVSQEKIKEVLDMMPIPRMTTLEDIANVVDFFLRPESSAITGQVIYLDGVPNS